MKCKVKERVARLPGPVRPERRHGGAGTAAPRGFDPVCLSLESARKNDDCDGRGDFDVTSTCTHALPQLEHLAGVGVDGDELVGAAYPHGGAVLRPIVGSLPLNKAAS